MTVHATRLGDNEDGTPHYNYWSDDPSKALVLTGPIQGAVTVAGGVVYDVSPVLIEVEPGHELLVSDAIGARHEAEGHPRHKGAAPFVHTPSALSHDPHGAPSTAYAAAVEAAVPAGEDSSPSGVMGRMNPGKG